MLEVQVLLLLERKINWALHSDEYGVFYGGYMGFTPLDITGFLTSWSVVFLWAINFFLCTDFFGQFDYYKLTKLFV